MRQNRLGRTGLVVSVSENRIERLFEYLDPSAVRAAFS